MPVEQFRGYVASIVAALLAVGALGIAAWAWYQPIDPQNPKDLALIYAMLGTAFGSATAWLFVSEGASRASHAALAAHEAGVKSQQEFEEPPPPPRSDGMFRTETVTTEPIPGGAE
jgi:hypothetical protein